MNIAQELQSAEEHKNNLIHSRWSTQPSIDILLIKVVCLSEFELLEFCWKYAQVQVYDSLQLGSSEGC